MVGKVAADKSGPTDDEKTIAEIGALMKLGHRLFGHGLVLLTVEMPKVALRKTEKMHNLAPLESIDAPIFMPDVMRCKGFTGSLIGADLVRMLPEALDVEPPLSCLPPCPAVGAR